MPTPSRLRTSRSLRGDADKREYGDSASAARGLQRFLRWALISPYGLPPTDWPTHRSSHLIARGKPGGPRVRTCICIPDVIYDTESACISSDRIYCGCRYKAVCGPCTVVRSQTRSCRRGEEIDLTQTCHLHGSWSELLA